MAQPAREEQLPDSSIVKRVPGVKISIPIVIGSFAQSLRKPISVPGEDWSLSHKWGCYVRGLRETSSMTDPMDEQDLTFLIKKVEFQIHESFPESLITIDKAPFEIHNAGYGEFPITITVYF
jgi:YEATS domain-containing protein 4